MSGWKERIDDVLVVILGGGRGTRLEPLTRLRAKPAVPIAGKYRLIDIPVSNAINSQMERMFVLTQYNSVSLHRHITRAYKFDIFSRGFVQILAAQQTVSESRWFQGTADAVRRNLRTIASTRGDLVLILSGDHLYRMDYRRMLRTHIDSGAEITLAALPCSEEEIGGFGAVRVDEGGRIVEFREKPASVEARRGMEASPKLLKRWGGDAGRPYLASMGIYLFNRQRLFDALDNELIDFGHDVIPAAVDDCKVQAHLFDGYWRDIGTIRSFYDAHLEMTRREPPFDFHDYDWPFYTHPRFLPGSRLLNCRFQESVLAGGAIVDDCDIKDAVIGLRTRMRKTRVRRTVIMGSEDLPPPSPPGAPPVGVGEGSVIEDAIVDLNARIGRNVRIVNEDRVQEAQGDDWVIREGIVVIPKNAVIPDGTVI